MTYEQEIINISTSSIISEPSTFKQSDVFDYRELPNEELYNQFYTFCRANIDIHSAKLNINPNYFIFTTDLRSNAQAIRIKSDYYLLINMGLIQSSIDHLLKNDKLDQFINKEYAELVSYFDNTVGALGFQIATQFAYYHEIAHLIQFSKKGETFSSLQEMYSSASTYNIKQHKLEINADTYAAFAITEHIEEYLRESFSDELSLEKAHNTFVILGVCLLNHIARFSNLNADIYFQKSSHPHPFLRLFNVILNIAHYLNNTSYFQENKIEVFSGGTMKKIFDLYAVLEKEAIFTTNFGTSLLNGEKVQDEIVEYLG
ncbi:hypothetical protein KNV96_19730, partial [Chryseobacterium indologenes]|uniref:hypothetical protein n=2 Tax=Chryseobacterium group TaxID=2782232 RepID=UPI001C098B13